MTLRMDEIEIEQQSGLVAHHVKFAVERFEPDNPLFVVTSLNQARVQVVKIADDVVAEHELLIARQAIENQYVPSAPRAQELYPVPHLFGRHGMNKSQQTSHLFANTIALLRSKNNARVRFAFSDMSHMKSAKITYVEGV